MCLLQTTLRCLAPGAAIEHRILRSEIGDAIGHASHPTAGILRLRYTSRTMAACGGPVAPWVGELVDLIYRQSGCRRRNSSLRLHHSEMPRHVAPCQSTSASEMGLVRLRRGASSLGVQPCAIAWLPAGGERRCWWYKNNQPTRP